MAELKLPLYITVTQVSKDLGWTYQRTKRWLKRVNCLIERGGRAVTTPALLRQNFPEIWDECLSNFEARNDSD